MLAYLLFWILPNKYDSVFLPITGYCFVGISYCLFASASWPIISFVVEQYAVGTAVGIGFCFQAIGVFTGSLVVGAIAPSKKDTSGDYQLV